MKTIDENTGETGQAGKAVNQLENYNVKDAIREVRYLADGLIKATRHTKHHFRDEWAEQLITRYRRLPGKPIIHLDDLGHDVIPTLSPDVRPLLIPFWKKLVAEHGYNWSMAQFRCARDIAVGANKVTRWGKLWSWRKFSALTGFSVSSLEPFVVALRVASSGTSRIITHPKLPFNLATPGGAKMIGYRGDAAYQTSAFINTKPILHEDYKQAITEVVGENPFTVSLRADGCDRTNVGVFVTMIASLAGLDNTQRQKKARNPFPSWFFVAGDEVVINGLQALRKAEGSGDERSIRICQAIGFDTLDLGDLSPSWPSKGSVWKLPKTTLYEVLRNPPPILSSASLLLNRYGIVSHIMPERYSTTQTGCSIYWTLSTYRGDNLQKFQSTITTPQFSELNHTPI